MQKKGVFFAILKGFLASLKKMGGKFGKLDILAGGFLEVKVDRC